MDARIVRVLELLGERWREPVNMAVFASACGLSRSRLEHLFKQQTGASIRQYILNKRLDEAARLLRSSELSVKAIRLEVGIPDSSNFCHLFRARFGAPPGRYRKENATGVQQLLPFN